MERPRTEAQEPETFAAFLAWLNTQEPQRQVIGLMAEFAAMVGSRRIEFLHLTLSQIDSEANTIRLMRAKQHGESTRVESVSITAGMEDLVRRLRALPRPEECLHVFTTRDGNPYTDDGFASTWQRAMAKALTDKIIPRRFTFHDLRAYYTTQHKAQYGALPELHTDAKTTGKIYTTVRAFRTGAASPESVVELVAASSNGQLQLIEDIAPKQTFDGHVVERFPEHFQCRKRPSRIGRPSNFELDVECRQGDGIDAGR